MTWSSRFVVHTVFCDGYDHTHTHNQIREAAEEYVQGLVTAIEPEPQQKLRLSANTDAMGTVPKHVRQVTMLVYDEDDNLIHHIDSGIFGCEDRSDSPELV